MSDVEEDPSRATSGKGAQDGKAAKGEQQQQPPPRKTPGIKVGEYTRADGTKVSNHKRTAPSKAKGGDDDDNEEGGHEEGQPPAKKGPTMTIDEFLAKPWVEKIAQQIGDDPDKADLANKDAAAAKQYHDRNAAIGDAFGGEERGSLGGFADFERALHNTLKASGYTNEKGRAIMKQFQEGFYQDDSGVVQTRILVPHLGDAGLDQLAMDVMSFKYVF